MTKSTMPSRSLTFKIEDNDYKSSYPNNGELMQIQSLKHSLSGDKYNEWVQGVTTADQQARFTADMIAFFMVCCPQLKADMKVDAFSSLDAVTNKKLLTVYMKIIFPWLAAWETFLNTDDETEEEEIDDAQ